MTTEQQTAKAVHAFLTSPKTLMTLAVAEAIAKGRPVSWIFYSTGEPIDPVKPSWRDPFPAI